MTSFTTPTTQTARKPHDCICCFRTIQPGESYQRGRGFDGGDAWTWRTCAHCNAIVSLYGPEDMEGMLSHDGHEGWADDQPRDWTEARHMAGWRMRWRTRSGELLPLPTRNKMEDGK